jgi:arylsulfatase A
MSRFYTLLLISILGLLPVSAKQPNIIYILADDLGYGDLGCYGQKVIKTPNLDRMAAEGIRFTQHYSGSTVCAPSRSCLLEGKHTGHTYVRGNGSLQMRPDPLDPIFPRALKNVGYHTALIGKSGLGCNTDDASLVNEKGFDYFFGYTSHTAAHFYYPDYSNNKKTAPFSSTSPCKSPTPASAPKKNGRQNIGPFSTRNHSPSAKATRTTPTNVNLEPPSPP